MADYSALVLLDFGGVIIDSPILGMKAAYKKLGLKKADIIARLEGVTEEWKKLERGEMSVKDFCVDVWEEKYPGEGEHMTKWFL